MAERRMFSLLVTDSDNFLDMPASAQALYFHLALHADDDGFLACARRIQRDVNASADDLKLLVAKRFLIPFDSGVVVVRHWLVHNRVRGDRRKPTIHTTEKALIITGANDVYELSTNCQPTDNQLSTNCQPTGCIGKDSIGKYSIGKDRAGEVRALAPRKFVPPTVDDVAAYCAEIGSSIDPQHFVDYYTARGWKLAKGTAVKDWKACLRTWEAREKKTPNGGERYAPTYQIDEAAELAAFVEVEDDG